MTFKGESLKEVVKKLADFRLVNNIPAGNPEQEVLTYYASKWPYLVKLDRESEIETQSQEYEEWRDWIYSTWKKPPQKFLSKKEAEMRWSICADCPFNQPKQWAETNESAELSRRAFILRRGMDAPENLGFCALHKTDLAAFTFIEAAHDFSAEKSSGLVYDACWVFFGGK